VVADEPPENGEEVTVWSDSLGKFKVEADFVELVDGKLVVLKRASDGKVIKIPLDKLDAESKSQAKSLHADAQQSSLDPAVEKQLEEMGLLRQKDTWRLKTEIEFDKLTRKVQSQLKSYVKSEKMKELSSSNKKDKEDSLAEKKLAAARAEIIAQKLPEAIRLARKKTVKKNGRQKKINANYTPSKELLDKIKKDFNHGREEIGVWYTKRRRGSPVRETRTPSKLDLNYFVYSTVRIAIRRLNDSLARQNKAKRNSPAELDKLQRELRKKETITENQDKNQGQRKKQLENLLNKFLVAHTELRKGIELINEKTDKIDKYLEGSIDKLHVPSVGSLVKQVMTVESNQIVKEILPSDVLYSGKGTVFKWHENGEIKSEGRITAGKREGQWTFWRENGRKWTVFNYKDDKKDGLSIRWDENGHKEWEGNFKNDKRDGRWTEWYENEQKKYEVQYKDGKQLSRKEF